MFIIQNPYFVVRMNQWLNKISNHHSYIINHHQRSILLRKFTIISTLILNCLISASYQIYYIFHFKINSIISIWNQPSVLSIKARPLSISVAIKNACSLCVPSALNSIRLNMSKKKLLAFSIISISLFNKLRTTSGITSKQWLNSVKS